MRNLRPRPALVAVLALLLVFAQQMAGAHMIGHLGGLFAPANAGAEQGDRSGQSDPVEADLSHACSTCVSIAGLAFAVPASALPPLAGDGAYMASALAPRAAPAAVDPHRYRARAPPIVS